MTDTPNPADFNRRGFLRKAAAVGLGQIRCVSRARLVGRVATIDPGEALKVLRNLFSD